MLRLKAFRASHDKIVKIELHPTHPWLVTANANDRVSVWNWEHRQVIYELKAGGVDERRLVGAKLEKLAEGELDRKGKPTEAIRGGSVKQIKFYDDDVRYWNQWQNRYTAAEAASAADKLTSTATSVSSTKGRHFLVVCCENKAIFLDLVTMRGRDVPKIELDNKSLLCMEFLSKSTVADSPLVAFGASDGVIRVLSMITWKLVRRYTGGHKGSISCLMTYMGSSGEAFLVSGGSDGLVVLWSAGHGQDSRELIPKSILKAHDGGVVGIDLSRVIGGAPRLITIGADKTLAVWDTSSLKELRRLKPVPKLACHSVASWCHPRAPTLDILTCAKDQHIWAIEHPAYSALSRPLCDLTSLLPPRILAQTKKLRVYCMAVHPLQPHLVATGTDIGVIISEFDPRALPAVASLPTSSKNREHSAVYMLERELKLLSYQLSNTGNNEIGKSMGDSADTLHVKQIRKRINAPVPHDSYAVLSLSSSGKYLAMVFPDIPYFSIYKVSDWSTVDSGSARLLAWDTCRDRFAILESAAAPRMPIIPKGSSRKAKEAAAAAAAQAAVATATSSGTVQVRVLLGDGMSNTLTRSIGGRPEPIVGLHGGALLGVVYRAYRRLSPINAAAISAYQSMPFSGYEGTGYDGFPSHRYTEVASPSFQLYSWETFQPVGDLLPQPEWTAWDQTVEYCAFAYRNYIVISSLRPQYRYLGDVSIPYATGGVWHRRQLFVVTPTAIECVFVDAGVAAIDIETMKRKEEIKLQEARARAVAEHGELALITVDGPHTSTQERMVLRPPMLQVVRLASFQHAPTVPPFLTLPKEARIDSSVPVMPYEMGLENKVDEVAVAGGGVSVAVTRFPTEQKRPVGPLVVVGVRDGVLWLIDRYMCAHALSLSHPGIRCRCLAAYGDAVSAVKWASRLGREHHDDLAQFLLGMGYATEALHLPGISKRLEFDLALKSYDLKRALQCLLTMSNSRDIGQDGSGLSLADILNITSKKEDIVEGVQGIVKFAKEFLDLIDAADATGQADIAREALKRLAAAGSVKGSLKGHELRGLALRLANHGELTRLGNSINNLITIGLGREAAFASAVLGDNALMEKAWQDTGMLAEAVLHAQAHGRPSLRNLVQTWNKELQNEMEQTPSTKVDAAAAFWYSLQEPKLTSLAEAGKKPPIEILPPGMPSLAAFLATQKKPPTPDQNPQEQAAPLMLEAPPSANAESEAAPATIESEAAPATTESAAAPAASTESAAASANNDAAAASATTEAAAAPVNANAESTTGSTATEAPSTDTSTTTAERENGPTASTTGTATTMVEPQDAPTSSPETPANEEAEAANAQAVSETNEAAADPNAKVSSPHPNTIGEDKSTPATTVNNSVPTMSENNSSQATSANDSAQATFANDSTQAMSANDSTQATSADDTHKAVTTNDTVSSSESDLLALPAPDQDKRETKGVRSSPLPDLFSF